MTTPPFDRKQKFWGIAARVTPIVLGVVAYQLLKKLHESGALPANLSRWQFVSLCFVAALVFVVAVKFRGRAASKKDPGSAV